jgi:hypothetical protein
MRIKTIGERSSHVYWFELIYGLTFTIAAVFAPAAWAYAPLALAQLLCVYLTFKLCRMRGIDQSKYEIFLLGAIPLFSLAFLNFVLHLGSYGDRCENP